MKATDFTIAGYPGGKTHLAPEIARRLIAGKAWSISEYREPFVGMGATLPYMYGRFPQIWINDLHPALVCMWRGIRDYPEQIQAAVCRIWPVQTSSRSTYKELVHELVEGLDRKVIDIDDPAHIVKYGAMKLVLHRISFNSLGEIGRSAVGGTAQVTQTVRHRFKLPGIYKAIQYHHVAMRRCERVEITNLDGLAVINDQSRRAAVYCDPLYFEKGNTLYRFKWSDAQHVALRDALMASPHWWLCSYDQHPRARKLYEGCRFEVCHVVHTIGHNGYAHRGEKKIAKEYLISSRHA